MFSCQLLLFSIFFKIKPVGSKKTLSTTFFYKWKSPGMLSSGESLRLSSTKGVKNNFNCFWAVSWRCSQRMEWHVEADVSLLTREFLIVSAAKVLIHCPNVKTVWIQRKGLFRSKFFLGRSFFLQAGKRGENASELFLFNLSTKLHPIKLKIRPPILFSNSNSNWSSSSFGKKG